MIRHIRMHGINDGHVVDMLCCMMKQLTDLDSAVAVTTKTKR